MKNKKILFSLFVLAQLFAFGFITLLKFQSPTKNIFGFLTCLVCMHVGIVLFIVSKKFFQKSGFAVKKFYSEEYFYLAFYIPVLIYKFVISNIWTNLALTEEVMLAIILTITAINVILSIRNSIRFAKVLKSNENEGNV